MSRERIKRKAKQRATGGSYICPLCGKGFTRRSTVKDPHFPTCVARHGNPNNIRWDADESCRARKVGRKNSGSSGATCVPRFQQPEEEDDEAENPGNEVVVLNDEELQQQQEPMGDWQDKKGATSVRESEVPSMTSGRWNPSNRSHITGFAVTEDEDKSTENLPRTPPSGCSLSNQTFSPESPMLPIERRLPLSVMTMNQIVNIPIKSCRIHAGKGDKEAQSMWHLWNHMVFTSLPTFPFQPNSPVSYLSTSSLTDKSCSCFGAQLPPGALTNITLPAPGLDQKSRQQAVVWMAQDVYAALLNLVRGLKDQLQMVVVWRDIAQGMDDADGVMKIHDLLVEELGEEGPMLLGEFGGVDFGTVDGVMRIISTNSEGKGVGNM